MVSFISLYKLDAHTLVLATLNPCVEEVKWVVNHSQVPSIGVVSLSAVQGPCPIPGRLMRLIVQPQSQMPEGTLWIHCCRPCMSGAVQVRWSTLKSFKHVEHFLRAVTCEKQEVGHGENAARFMFHVTISMPPRVCLNGSLCSDYEHRAITVLNNS